MKSAINKIFSLSKAAAGAALLAFIGSLTWTPQAQAQAVAVCNKDFWNTWTPWLVQPLTEDVRSGQVLAQASTTVRTHMLKAYPEGAMMESTAVWWGAADNAFHTVALNGVPGVGMRIRWAGVTSPGGFSTLTTVPEGSPLNFANYNLIGTLNPVANAEFTETFTLELVVTDIDAYVGGNADLAPVNRLYVHSQNKNDGFGCGPTLFPSFPPEPLRSIVLPRPPVPSCEFDTVTLNQTVPLSPAGSSSVARSNAPRSAGTAGEKTFTIEARNCAAGATFNLYFTDALAEGSAQDYLRQANGSNVGVRIYHANAATPVQFGPAPVGSTLPARAPITVGGPGAEKGASHTLPFTAQYVQLPDATGTPTVGEVGAKAKVTVVYP